MRACLAWASLLPPVLLSRLCTPDIRLIQDPQPKPHTQGKVK